MTGAVKFSCAAATPDHRAVLTAQGIPDGAEVPPRVGALVDEALEIFAAHVDAVGTTAEISIEEFDAIYPGDGRNAHDNPLEAIYPDARRLALYAVTVGEPVCAEIRRLFDAGDPALGYTLDTIASTGAEGLADSMAREYELEVTGSHPGASRVRVLPYSPGYCGWHVSGQAKLFEALRPESIGITLNPSFLMQPLKSVSGVLVAAEREIHDFDIDFEFCADCADQNCRERIHSVLDDSRGGQ